MRGVLIMYSICALSGCAVFSSGGDVYLTGRYDKLNKIELTKEVDSSKKISLTHNGFRIVAPGLSKDVPIQVCATNRLSPISEISIGKKINETNCFGVGKGMAMYPTNPPNYDIPLVVSDGEAHNYYSHDRRKNQRWQTTISVNSVGVAHGGTLDETYIAIVVDVNKNGIVDANEAWFADVVWK